MLPELSSCVVLTIVQTLSLLPYSRSMLLRPSERRYRQLDLHHYLVSTQRRHTRTNLIITRSYSNLPYGFEDFRSRCTWTFHPETRAPIHVESIVYVRCTDDIFSDTILNRIHALYQI